MPTNVYLADTDGVLAVIAAFTAAPTRCILNFPQNPPPIALITNQTWVSPSPSTVSCEPYPECLWLYSSPSRWAPHRSRTCRQLRPSTQHISVPSSPSCSHLLLGSPFLSFNLPA